MDIKTETGIILQHLNYKDSQVQRFDDLAFHLYNKRNTSDRHWKTFNNLEEARKFANGWCDDGKWMYFIHKCEGNY